MTVGRLLPRTAAVVAAVLIAADLILAGSGPTFAHDASVHDATAHDDQAHEHAAHVPEPSAVQANVPHAHVSPMPGAPLMSRAPETATPPRATPAQDVHGAYGQGHEKLHYWYETLKQPGTGMSCCNNEDCRPTVSRTVGDAVQVEVDGEWATVPPEKIVKSPSPDLGSHVCAPKHTSLFPKGFVYCAVIGSGV